jgi:hypothetical protein
MDAISKAERMLHKKVSIAIDHHLYSEDTHSRGSSRKHLVILMGGAFGSEPLVCEDLLHASTPPQVETARTYELAKCRGNEG